ncbi:hypothetical protein MYK68_09230 [Gordonia sp. PP30]|uniref:hypothetical protein n=1 Tax=Gordonia sp. PP30 TaxID=2935861 RepID=UPI001FFE4F13|nr:hypothetical protein [Gordonia sp. PP30]UQE76718.1 hypothetical protein MYK68_09230 [Gordonia sp. PP30]
MTELGPDRPVDANELIRRRRSLSTVDPAQLRADIDKLLAFGEVRAPEIADR